MVATESWNTDNVSASAVTLGLFAAKGSLLVQAEMSPVIVVVTNLLIHQPFQMPLIENDHMIEQITTAIAYEALGHAILPRALERSAYRLCAQDFRCPNDFCIEDGVTVMDQIAGSGIVGKGLTQLLNNPRAGRMPGHVEVQNTTPVMRDDEEAVENAEGE